MVAKPLIAPGGKAGPSISVALCTCNGARFLGEQFESLARQTRAPCELVVGDDASDDATLAIAKRFAARAPFPVRMIARSERIGHAANFLATARECAGEWIAFADQDDVWFEGKLAEVAAVIARHSDVLLVNQRAQICDESLAPRTGGLFPPDPRPGLHLRPHRALPLVWPGFLMTFDARLIRDFDPTLRPSLANGSAVGHGRWTFLLAAALGSYFVTDTPSAFYRRHADALTGDYRGAPRSLSTVSARAHAAVAEQLDHARSAVATLAELAACADETDRSKLAAAAGEYARAAAALAKRNDCYGDGFARRVAAWLSATRCGAYFGPPLQAGGIKAALKDATSVLGL